MSNISTFQKIADKISNAASVTRGIQHIINKDFGNPYICIKTKPSGYTIPFEIRVHAGKITIFDRQVEENLRNVIMMVKKLPYGESRDTVYFK